MGKSVIVINTPTTCAECEFLNSSFDYPECLITKDTRGYMFKKSEARMASCPLRDLPEYKVCFYEDKYIEGFNDCLDEILY